MRQMNPNMSSWLRLICKLTNQEWRTILSIDTGRKRRFVVITRSPFPFVVIRKRKKKLPCDTPDSNNEHVLVYSP